MLAVKASEMPKESQRNYIFDFINEYFSKANNINKDGLKGLRGILVNKFKIKPDKSQNFIENWLKECGFHAIMIDNSVSFLEYAEKYYYSLRDKNTEIDINFFSRVLNWIEKVPENNKLEIAKRLFVYEFISEKLQVIVNESND